MLRYDSNAIARTIPTQGEQVSSLLPNFADEEMKGATAIHSSSLMRMQQLLENKTQ
jgi:hypothetical protein